MPQFHRVVRSAFLAFPKVKAAHGAGPYRGGGDPLSASGPGSVGPGTVGAVTLASHSLVLVLTEVTSATTKKQLVHCLNL